MAKTSIEWTRYTFNPWEGCEKVSPACKLCYAWRRDKWIHRGANWGATAPRLFRKAAYWRQPVKWNREAERAGERQRVFCGSLMDIFERHADPGVAVLQAEARARLGAVIRTTPHLIWMLLTKRPEYAAAAAMEMGFDEFPANCWLGVTVETQEYDWRVVELLNIPCQTRFLSLEPLLGMVTLREVARGLDVLFRCDHQTRVEGCCANCSDIPGIDLVITGGESGDGARPSHPDWFRKLRDECVAAGVPFFFKQWGEYRPLGSLDFKRVDSDVISANEDHSVMLRVDGTVVDEDVAPLSPEEYKTAYMMERVGKKNAGRLLDGVEWSELPEVADVRPPAQRPNGATAQPERVEGAAR